MFYLELSLKLIAASATVPVANRAVVQMIKAGRLNIFYAGLPLIQARFHKVAPHPLCEVLQHHPPAPSSRKAAKYITHCLFERIGAAMAFGSMGGWHCLTNLLSHSMADKPAYRLVRLFLNTFDTF
jgi:hypothetical protein